MSDYLPTAARTHDFSGRNRRWGRDYTFKPVGLNGGKMAGWGRGLADGDFLIVDHPDGGTTRYLIDSVSYFSDPRDMWSARVTFAPRPIPSPEKGSSETRPHREEEK